MKVILKKEVDNLGTFGDQVKVAKGYARNYLIPYGFAVEATPGNLKQFETERTGWEKKVQQKKENAEKLAAEVSALTLEFRRKAGEEDKLFGSVTSHDIGEALAAKGFEFEKKSIHLDEPIKAIGEFTVEVKVHPEVTASVKVTVEKED